MPRFRTITTIAVIVAAVTDVTWDGSSLHVSFGLPGGRRFASFVFP